MIEIKEINHCEETRGGGRRGGERGSKLLITRLRHRGSMPDKAKRRDTFPSIIPIERTLTRCVSV